MDTKTVGGESTVVEVKSCQVLLKTAKESTTKGDGTAGRKKKQQQKSQRSVDRSGRPTCTMCTGFERSTGPVDRNTLSAEDRALGLFRSTGPVDRERESVDRTGRPIVGSGRKLLFREVMYLSPGCNFLGFKGFEKE